MIKMIITFKEFVLSIKKKHTKPSKAKVTLVKMFTSTVKKEESYNKEV